MFDDLAGLQRLGVGVEHLRKLSSWRFITADHDPPYQLIAADRAAADARTKVSSVGSTDLGRMARHGR
jgi:hypothetical protein